MSRLAASLTRPEAAWRMMFAASLAIILVSGWGVTMKIRHMLKANSELPVVLAQDGEPPLQLSRVELNRRPTGEPVAVDGH